MARSTYGATSVDWLLRPYPFGSTTLVALRTGTTFLTFWNAAFGGTRYTDLLDAVGTPITQVTVVGHQIPLFQGPDAVLAMWADKGDGSPRERIEAQDLAAAASAVAAAEAARDQAAATVASKVDKGSLFTLDTDSANLSAALAATSVGGILEIRGTYTVTTPFTIDKACTIRFARGAQITATSGHAIVVAASGVTLDRPKVVGSGSGTAGTSAGIQAVGTAVAQITDLRIIRPNVSAFSKYGIFLEHVVGFGIDRPTVSNIAYTGIMMLSCIDGEVQGGSVKTITQPSGFTNSYGIAMSRNEAQSIVDAPRTSRVTINGVLVDGVTNWEGIDTHGGSDLKITNCRIINCQVGIALVPTKVSGVETYAPQRCTIVGNTIDAAVSDGSRSNGIQVVGAGVTAGSPVEASASCLVIGNTVIDHGAEASASSSAAGAIVCYFTQSLVIAANTIVRAGQSGIHIFHSNNGLLLQGNTIEDAWTTSAALVACVYMRSTFNSVTVSNTRIVRGSKTATVVNGRGLSVSTTTSNDITDSGGNNWSAATLATSGATTLMRYRVDAPLLGFFSATPVAKPTVTGSRGGNAALASLLTGLAGLGLVTDSTSA